MALKQQSEKGFTIVEIIVAATLMTLAVATLVSMMVAAQYAQRNAYYTSEASRAAFSKIEETKVKPFKDISMGTTYFSGDQSLNNLPAGSVGQIVVSPASFAPDSKQIDVTVTYTVGTVQKKVSMTAYVDPLP